MHPLALADELAEIRADIARLKAREAEFRDQILAAPRAALAGRWYRVEVTEHRVRLFDPSLLPAAIRNDPAYWRERSQVTVRTLSVQGRGQRPGWPICRSSDTGETAKAMH